MKDMEAISYLIAHICISDGSIHDEEIKFIEDYCIKYELDELSKEMIHKILGDTDDKISLDEVLLHISKDDKLVEICFEEAMNLVYADGFFDPMEEIIVEKMLKVTKYDRKKYLDLKMNIIKKKNESNIIDADENIIDKSKKILLSIFKNITTGKLKENLEKEYKKFLLKGKEYKQEIENMSRIALKDFELSENIMGNINKSYTKLIEDTDKLLKDDVKYKNSNNENEKKYYDVMLNFQTDLKDIILKRIEENQMSMSRKKRAIDCYTISFIGKTKAGKSTLHALITGKGKEFIGKGQQRTTRFNRIYEWEKIRIIDTPGIGAPGGKTDEKIAESILEESDLICYVLKNDSVQESEFAFLKMIKEHNKPIVILLNAKENIENDVKLELYLKDPNKWYDRKDEKSLEGHFNRIRLYANQHYKNGFFNIYPVQLLAAQMSFDDKHKNNSKVLYDSSHIEEFLTEIRMQIINEGVIRKSQNIIDGTICVVNEALNILTKNNDNFKEINAKIIKNKKEIIKKIENSYEDNRKNIINSLDSAFEELKEKHAREFADENYEETDQDSISERWEQHINRIGFNKTFEKMIENHFNSYMQDIKEYLKEAEQNFALINKIATKNTDFKLSSVVDTRGIMGILGNIVGTVGTIIALFFNPIGWAYAIGGAILSFFSSFFESHEEKVRKAINKLHGSIKESISKAEEPTKEQTIKNFSDQHKKIVCEISNSFDIITTNIQRVMDKLNHEINMLDENSKKLNTVYGFRILNFINNDKSESIPSNIHDEITVERQYGKKIILKTRKFYAKETAEKLKKIIQEEIEFVRIIQGG